MTKIFILLFLIFQVSAVAKEKTARKVEMLTGIVRSCHDGDTCRVEVKNKLLKIRFSGIDTPEKKQKYGVEAKQYTEKLVLHKQVDMECEGKSFDRLTCTLFHENKNINEELVKAGWAWDSKRYSKGKYQQIMNEAKMLKKGMWVDTKISPFCYRHKESKKCRVSQLYME